MVIIWSDAGCKVEFMECDQIEKAAKKEGKRGIGHRMIKKDG